MGIDTVSLMELFTRHRDKSGRVDTSALASELGKAYCDPAEVLEQFLGMPDTGDWRYYEFDIMRELAEQGQLSREEALRFLEKMCLLSLSARLDADEFYDTIYAMAGSRKTAPVLVEFVQDHLLAKQDVRDWRWLAFTAVGEVKRKRTARIPVRLMKNLKKEAENEEDPHRKRQLREFLYFPEVREIYATRKIRGVTVRDSVWREALRFEADTASPSLTATFVALRALYDVDPLRAKWEIYRNCTPLDEFVMKHYDEKSGGFRHHQEASPSLYGTFWAVLSVPWAWDVLEVKGTLPTWLCLVSYFQHGSDLAPSDKGRQYLGKILGFIDHCLSSSDGWQAFADTPGGQPTITATDGAVQLLDSSGIWSLPRRPAVNIPENLLDPVAISEKVVDFITACGRGGSFGFANHPEEQSPQSDVTRYCLRALATVTKILDSTPSVPGNESRCQEVRRKIDGIFGKRDDMVKFLTACRKDGGFAKFEREKPSVMYTDVALRCLWENLYPEDARKIDEVAGYHGLLAYLEGLVPGNLAFVPGSAQNIFAVRSATSILSLILEAYPDRAEEEADRLGRLMTMLEEAIWQHNVEGELLFTAYRMPTQNR